MIKRMIDISGPNTHVNVEHRQILVRRDGEIVSRIPAEDIGILIIDTPRASYTHNALLELLDQGVAVVLCGPDHLPAGQVLPQTGNGLLTLRMRQQCEAPKPLGKRLWRQIVQAKIRNQAAVMEFDEIRDKLLEMSGRVKSGDPENVESQAARIYWRHYLYGEEFLRQPEGLPPNPMLNYGYAAMRGCVARAICGAGLHPAFGLNHSNRFNPFCLADDLVEPFRPLVDARVRLLWREGTRDLDKQCKTGLLSLLDEPCELRGHEGPLMLAVERMAHSLCACYAGERKLLDLPMVDPAAPWNRGEEDDPEEP